MKAIILAAGQGRRLSPLTDETPKSAVRVGDRAILEWQLGELAQAGIDEVVAVTGFQPHAVEAILANGWGMTVRTVHNPFYAHADNLGTCWAARAEFDGSFLLINGDTLFEADVVRSLLAGSERHPITLATDHKGVYDDDDMKVVVRDDGRLLRVGKRLARDHVNGESIGMMLFHGVGPALFRQKVEDVVRRDDGLRKWYLSAIDELARERHVGSCSIHGLGWCEIDYRSDLEHATRLVRAFNPLPAVAEA
ncbi:MAG: phosphocholine cytidylyltransferase family protein [Gammaproteobacteria bacterium]|nr:phosphocholine cytidylyltransferase family protein [Gammaproteobacteria bacterium]